MRFTSRELDVMSVLWREGSGTVAEVRELEGVGGALRSGDGRAIPMACNNSLRFLPIASSAEPVSMRLVLGYGGCSRSRTAELRSGEPRRPKHC